MKDRMSEMMKNCMESMGGEGPEKMKQMMTQMMPEMMIHCMGSMDSGVMMETMHEIMPKMMEHCMSSMNKEEREKMLNFCHTMLKDMEERFLKT